MEHLRRLGVFQRPQNVSEQLDLTRPVEDDFGASRVVLGRDPYAMPGTVEPGQFPTHGEPSYLDSDVLGVGIVRDVPPHDEPSHAYVWSASAVLSAGTLSRVLQGPVTKPVTRQPFRSLAAQADLTEIQGEVLAVASAASNHNWDGENALPVNPDTVRIAQSLVVGFLDFPDRPEVSVSPEGRFDFDWHLSKNRMFTVSIGPLGDIAFSGLYEGSRMSGTEFWTGSLPRLLRCGLQRLYEQV